MLEVASFFHRAGRKGTASHVCLLLCALFDIFALEEAKVTCVTKACLAFGKQGLNQNNAFGKQAVLNQNNV